MKKSIFKIVLWTCILAAMSYLVYYFFFIPPQIVINFQSEAVEEASLFKEVSATGTINPIEVVEVGTQVSGSISELFVDFNDHVRKGQVIARIDMRNLMATLEESQANLAKAEMSLQQAKRDKNRLQRLFEKGAVTGVECERATDAYLVSVENKRLAQLQVEKNTVNLGYATIISPIDGIIVSRNIDEGQTVAASFATPTLFRIANDLRKMKIEASVDEADIGQVKQGQKVVYTVDTYAGEDFEGVVEEVQLQPIVLQNVVTYKVIILINNPDNKLLPGMTATLIIKTHESPKAATIPNSAFTFHPKVEDIEVLTKSGYKVIMDSQPSENKIWIKEGHQLIEKRINPVFTNGIRTALIGDEVNYDSVVTNLDIELKQMEKGGNLFMPRKKD